MNKVRFAKICGVLCVLTAVFAMLLDGFTFIVPLNDLVLSFGSIAETAQNTVAAIVITLAFIGLLPLVLGLFSYYFAGGIGDSWFSKILIALLLGIAVLLPIIGIFDFLILSGDSQKIVGGILVILYLLIVLTPVVFTVIAFIVSEIALWKRFVPLIAFILYLLIPVILGGISILSALYLDSDETGTLFQGIGQAVVPQWLLLGSIAWSLLSLPAFMKSKEIGEERMNVPPSPQEYFPEST